MPDLQENNKRIAKNTMFLYIRMAIILIISLYSSRVILQSLGVVDYGIHNVVAGFVALFSFLNSSLTASIQRFYNFRKATDGNKGVHEVFHVSILSQVLLVIMFVVLLETIGLWYVSNKLVVPIERFDAAQKLFQLTVVSSVIVILQVPFSAIVISHERMNVYACISIINALLRLVAVISIPFWGGDRLEVYGILLLAISLIEAIIYIIYTRCVYSFVFKLPVISRDLFKDMLSFSAWNMFGALSFILKNQGLNMILNLFFGPVVNAARGVSMQISSGLKNFVPGIYTAARPQLVEAYASNDRNRVNSIFFSSSKLCFFVLYIVVLPVAFEIDYVLKLWLGDNVPQYTNIFTILVLAISLVDILNTPVSMVVLATGKVKIFNIVSSMIGLSVLPLTYITLQLGADPEAVFVCALVVSCAIQIASLILLQIITNIRLKLYIQKIVIPIVLVMLLSLPVGFAITKLIAPSIYRVIITTGATMASSAFAIYKLALSKSEKNLVKEFLNKIALRIKS